MCICMSHSREGDTAGERFADCFRETFKHLSMNMCWRWWEVDAYSLVVLCHVYMTTINHFRHAQRLSRYISRMW